MAGEKRFGTSLFGFTKSDVNYYIEKILKEFDERLKEKDQEIDNLRIENRDIKARHDELLKKAHQVSEDRDKIAGVLIKAQEKAELILDEARKQAYEEKKHLEELNEIEKEKLVDIKVEIKALKNEVVNTLRKFENQLDCSLEDEAAATAEDE